VIWNCRITPYSFHQSWRNENVLNFTGVLGSWILKFCMGLCRQPSYESPVSRNI
jgi:hypothetical protein